MTQTERAFEYLLKDPLSYIDMLEPLRHKTADIIYADNDGVVIYERNSQTCMIAMQEIEKCQSIVALKKYQSFAVHQKNISEWILQNGEYSHSFEVHQAVYSKKEKFTDCFDKISVLNSDYTEQICQNYDAIDDKEYIETLLQKKQLWGIFDNGALAGFIGEHLEGSMGLLKVLPEYQRKGYGYKLQAFLINRFLKLNKIPFCQVAADNVKSLALQRKIGMEISRQTVIWIFN